MFFMRRITLVVVLSGLAVSCATLSYELPPAQEDALRRFEQELAEIRPSWSQTGASTFVEAEREYQRRLLNLMARYGYKADEFVEAELTYRLATAGRLDRKEMTPSQANALTDEFAVRLSKERARLEIEKEELRGLRQRDPAGWAAYWSRFSQRMDQMTQGLQQYQVRQGVKTPIQCTTQYVRTIALMTCY